jgi:hypothetical protein
MHVAAGHTDYWPFLADLQVIVVPRKVFADMAGQVLYAGLCGDNAPGEWLLWVDRVGTPIRSVLRLTVCRESRKKRDGADILREYTSVSLTQNISSSTYNY